MRLLRTILLVAPLLTLFLQGVLPRPSNGLPLFARKYGVACTTCHLAFPRLNSFGMAFRQNGYRMPAAKGTSPWEDKEFPLSLVANVGLDYFSTDAFDSAAGKRQTTSTSEFVQNTVEFHSAGTLAPEITFHFDNNFEGVDGPLNSGMAFVMFDDVAKDGALNVKLGIYDQEIPYLSDSRRTTWTHYLSPVTLGAEGFELNGTKSDWTYALGLGNSSRTHGKSTDRSLNQLENTYAWLMRDFNGQLVTARVILDRQDPRDTTTSSSLHTQAELSAYLNHGRWVLIPGFTYEKFDKADETLFDPENLTNGARDKIETALLEGLVFLDKDSKWLLTARYEQRQMPKFMSLVKETDQEIVGGVNWYANPNARLGLEWSHLSDDIDGPKTNEVQAYVHLGY